MTEKIKQFFKNRGLYYYLMMISTVLAIILLVVYLTSGRTQFDPNYSKEGIAAMVISVALGIFCLIRTYRAAIFAQYVCLLFSTISFITSQLNMIANIIYNVDGSSFPATFFVAAISGFVATFVALTAGIISYKRGHMFQSLAKKENRA